MATPNSSGVTVIIAGQDDLGPVLDRISNENLERFKRQSEVASNALSSGMGHSVTQVQAASAALRSLEGAVPIRAVERFITLIPGVGAALVKAFSVVGLIDFGIMAGDSVGKLVQFYREAELAGSVIAKAYRDTHSAAQLANDELRVTNDRLQNDIDKLEHKPQNNLALALDESRVAADKLARSLEEDQKRSADLLKQNEIGFWKGLATGKAPTSDVAGTVNYYHGKMADAAADAADATHDGNSAALADANKRLADARDAYSRWLNQQIKTRSGTDTLEDVVNADGSVSKGGTVSYSTTHGDQSANLAILRGERAQYDDRLDQSSLEQVNSRLTTQKSALESSKGIDDNLRQLREAADKLAAAKRELSEAEDREQAAQAKAGFEEQLAANDAAHKELLKSDEDYYYDKATLQDESLGVQKAAIAKQQAEVQSSISTLSGEKLSGKNAIDRDAEIARLKAKIVALDGQSAKLTAEQAANTAKLSEELDALSRKRISDQDAAASRLESARGGSTSARSKQSSDEYSERRREMVAEYGSDEAPAVQDLDSLQGLDQARIRIQGANETYGVAHSDIEANRKSVGDLQSRGQISDQSAQQQRIALDKEEADALEKLLPAYRAAAALGDTSAAEKVVQLQQQINELKTPVSQVALEMRNQFDSAFEQLFENLDRGKKAWENFAKSLQNDILKDTYKQFIQPVLQQGASALVPGARSGAGPSGVAGSGTASAASIIGGTAAKLFGLPSKAKTGAGAGITVQIINQTSSPASATASGPAGMSQDELTDLIRPSVIQVTLEDLDKGGSIAQAIGGGGGLLST